VNTFNCYKSNNVQTSFVRVYNRGQVDANGPSNVRNAFNVNMGIEIYMTPQTQGGQQCAQQLDDTYNYLTNNGVTVRSIWLQVTQPITWPNSPQSNQNFISSCMQRAASRGLNFGVFTNNYDWQQITGGWFPSNPNLNLWYWNYGGSGSIGQSAPNFNDFTPFAGFNNPLVKQYGQSMNLCSTTINYDVYKISKDSRKMTNASSTDIIVGELMPTPVRRDI